MIVGALVCVSVGVGAEERVAPIAASTTNGRSALVLMDYKGACPKGTREAVLAQPADGALWSACWEKVDEVVYVHFDDGDELKLDADKFKWYAKRGA